MFCDLHDKGIVCVYMLSLVITTSGCEDSWNGRRVNNGRKVPLCKSLKGKVDTLIKNGNSKGAQGGFCLQFLLSFSGQLLPPSTSTLQLFPAGPCFSIKVKMRKGRGKEGGMATGDLSYQSGWLNVWRLSWLVARVGCRVCEFVNLRSGNQVITSWMAMEVGGLSSKAHSAFWGATFSKIVCVHYFIVVKYT